MTKKENEERKEIEIPDTWVDFLMCPLGVLVGALLELLVEFLSR